MLTLWNVYATVLNIFFINYYIMILIVEQIYVSMAQILAVIVHLWVELKSLVLLVKAEYMSVGMMRDFLLIYVRIGQRSKSQIDIQYI